MALEADVGYDRTLQKITKPYNEEAVTRLLALVNGQEKFLQTRALFFLFQLIKQAEVPATRLQERICPDIASLEESLEPGGAGEDEMESRLPHRIRWYCDLAVNGDPIRRQKLLTDALRRQDSDADFYVSEAVHLFVETAESSAEKILREEMTREETVATAKIRIEAGLQKLATEKELSRLAPDERLRTVQSLLRSALQGHRAVLDQGGDRRILLLDRLEWLLQEAGGISGSAATQLLREVATDGNNATIVRTIAEYSLVERGDLENRYTLVSPIL